MTRVDRIAGIVAALLTTTGIVWASNVRMSPHSAENAMLRVAWRARPARIEVCTTASADVQASLPAHMRQTQICEGTTASYRLEVRRGDQVVVAETVRGGGLRHDRPLYVFRELAIQPGEVEVSVRFTRIEPMTPTEAAGGTTESDLRGPRTPGRELLLAVPASLSLERRLHTRPGEVTLVTYDPDRRELLVVAAPRN